MKGTFKPVSCVAVALGALGFSVSAALAAPPSNDTFGGATVAAIGFGEVLDTSDATTDSDDAQLNVSCDAPATDAQRVVRAPGDRRRGRN